MCKDKVQNTIVVNVDTTGIDAATEKASKLVELLREADELIQMLSAGK